MKQAIVNAKVFNKENDNLVEDHTTTMSTDLPAGAIGELVTDAIHAAWKNGMDPVNMKVELTFK